MKFFIHYRKSLHVTLHSLFCAVLFTFYSRNLSNVIWKNRGIYFYLFCNFGCGIVSSISGKVLYFKWRKAIMKSWSTEFSLLCWNLILKNQYLRNIWNFKNYRISAPKINWLLNIVREINQIFKDFKNNLHNILKRGLTIHHLGGTDDLALSRLSYRAF